MKAVKVAFKVLLWLVVLVVVAVLTLPLWLGPIATTVANAVVPGIVKTDFHLGRLSVNPYTVRFELGDLRLSNPEGYSVKDAARVGDLFFDVKTFSLLTDVIHIEEITVRDLYVSVVGSKDKNGVMNFRQIQYNVVGGKEKYEAAQSEQEATVASSQDNPDPAQEPKQKAGAKKTSKKFIIDRLEISGLTIYLGFIPVNIPSFVMTDIGASKGGATAMEIGLEIWNEILKRAGVVGDQLKTLGLDVADRTTKRAGKLVNRTTSQATEAINDSVKKASDGAKKAMDALKGLW